MTPSSRQDGHVAAPVTTLVLGALAGTLASRMLRLRSAGVRAPEPIEIETETSTRLATTRHRLDETSAKLRLVTQQLDETRAALAEAQAEVLQMSGTTKAMTDRAEAEMGRMESAAIAALESAAASNRQEVAGLRQSLAAAEEAARVLRADLDAERRRTALIESALASRDVQLADLRATVRDTDDHRA
jgi:chromosome segregation ATPase